MCGRRSTACSPPSAQSSQAFRSSSACLANVQHMRASCSVSAGCLHLPAQACRVDSGMPLREALERLHGWLYQHGYIEPRSHSCPVTWTGGPLCSCKSARLSPITSP